MEYSITWRMITRSAGYNIHFRKQAPFRGNLCPLSVWYLPFQARGKHKMIGGAEWVAHINSPPASVPRLKHTSWYMSVHYICLQYLLFLSLIFRLCWLWGNWELVWDIIRGKFAKQVLSVFFLPNEVISYHWRQILKCQTPLTLLSVVKASVVLYTWKIF